jgi:hypothetical protein
MGFGNDSSRHYRCGRMDVVDGYNINRVKNLKQRWIAIMTQLIELFIRTATR